MRRAARKLLAHRRWYYALALVTACAVATPGYAADAPDDSTVPAVALLKKMHAAARQLDYAGVYTYQHGSTMVSSRVTHVVDGTGERERIEMLDGPQREFLRHNDITQFLVPEKKLVVVERRRMDRFPALLLGDGAAVGEHYEISIQPTQRRIAGRECTVIQLLPRDEHRYGYRLCADTETNLLLKAQTVSLDQGVVDQISFTSLQLGDKVVPGQLASNWNFKDWRVLETAMTPIDLAAKGWRIPFPPGFAPVTQVSRPMKAGRPVSQMVITDGLAAISIFIEPHDPAGPPAGTGVAASKGAMNIYRTRVGEFWLTTLGEVPAGTLRDIAESTEYVPLASH
ncbi:MucB/RseB C-terminal domain-containing protein [Pollutimonas thiosulfatoxidans]|uniref:Siderophore-interacting protein n=1 Tax=Pollutimonas thiosulfatoxidans TaxID=2028345 RepID=A0A410G918_9BURK|nr:MucB/RseB C-terminal domain-containing protein [Pollutimonas thiosulfatoxidans]MBF6615664.1 MucB/RseB C-terminal domain-containing protein [Candidimonas sp.]QAA92818.1 siderophore-interacting protein [Pollutimonas thiosulfatoxidans]